MSSNVAKHRRYKDRGRGTIAGVANLHRSAEEKISRTFAEAERKKYSTCNFVDKKSYNFYTEGLYANRFSIAAVQRYFSARVILAIMSRLTREKSTRHLLTCDWNFDSD